MSLTCPLVYNDRGLVHSGSASDSAGVCRHSSCASETGPQLSAVAVMVAMNGFFGLFRPLFALLQVVVPELSASFWSLWW